MTNFSMRAGDSKNLRVTVTDLPDGAGDPVNITNATIRWHLARRVNTAALIEKATGGSGITITDAAAGRFDVALAPADTEDLAGDYYHEAEVIDENDNVSTVLSGLATIGPDLIKPA